MPRSSLIRGVGIAAFVTAISAAHHATDPALVWLHVAYQDLCYAPILVAAYWFGVPGGLAVALVAGLGTTLHFQAVWQGNTPFLLAQYGQAIGFIIAGVVGGLLATAQKRAVHQYRASLAAAEGANKQLQQSHEQLVRADRLSSLGEIAAGLAHEIGNPLAGIKGALEIIASRAKAESPEAEFSAVAIKELGRLDALVAEFLRFARPHPPRRTAVDIIDVLDRVVALLDREASDRGVAIRLQRGVASQVWIDPDQMIQVFMNIVLNGLQVSPKGSQLLISTSTRDGMLAVDVADDGPGIKPEDVPKVFDPFFSTKKRGTGLGLSISSRIVVSHNGRIEIVQPGRGTLVRVLVPFASAERSEPRPESGGAA